MDNYIEYGVLTQDHTNLDTIEIKQCVASRFNLWISTKIDSWCTGLLPFKGVLGTGICFGPHIGVLIFAAQLQFARRIARAKTDVPVFNQIFVLCLVFSGWLDPFLCINSRHIISGIATAISLPLTVWIVSLEDQEDQQLRQKLCSVVVVVNWWSS